MNVAKNNKILYIIASTLHNASLLCASGTLMQTLIEILGFPRNLNYIHTTLLQMVQVLTILVCSKWADKGNIIRRMMLIRMLYGLMFLFYVPICIIKNAPTEIFILLLAVGIFQKITIALSTVCEYKIPYFIFDSDDYVSVVAVSGIISGVVSMGFSALISVLTNYFDYKTLMIFAFILSAIFATLGGVMYSFQKSLVDMDSIQQKKNDKSIRLAQVFRHPAFYKLFAANVLRGFAAGTTGVLAIVAFDIGFNESVTTMMVPLSSAAMFMGCAIVGIASLHMSHRVLIFAGSVTFLLLPLLFVQNRIVFLAVYTIILLGRNIVDVSVPATLLKVVPARIAGPYNAWRMILHSAGTLLATYVVSVISPSVLFALAILAQMISGISFMRIKELKKS